MKTIKINKKEFPIRIHLGKNPKYAFVTHHGIMSNKGSWRYFEKWVKNNAIIVNYDARLNGDNIYLKASRRVVTYVNDLRDIVIWTKKKWPKLKIIVLGSSWGATVVTQFIKKYPSLCYKGVAWSIPMRIIPKNEKTPTVKPPIQVGKKLKDYETGIFGYTWKFLLMILFNVNTKSYTNLDMKKITSNTAIHRIVNINKKSLATPVKLFYITIKLMKMSFPAIKKINNKYNNKMLYIQSTIDEFVKKKKLPKLRKITGKGVKYIELNEGVHAFQWEIKDNLNHRVFQMLWKFLEENNV